MEASTKKVLAITGVAIVTGVVLGGVIVLIQASAQTMQPGTVPVPPGQLPAPGGTGSKTTSPTTRPPSGAQNKGSVLTAVSNVWDSIWSRTSAAAPPSASTDPKSTGSKTAVAPEAQERSWWDVATDGARA